MRTLNKEQADPLVAAICRGQLWATPEETAAWLKTETGQRIAALIERERCGISRQKNEGRNSRHETTLQNTSYYSGSSSH